ncbi:MAG TPA: hypothetical protein VK657_12915, partial [Terriglobales bacterium]|nr:hypothetical protein [Terriglobales bacterium]
STAVNRARQEAESRYRNALAERYALEQGAAAYAGNQERLARSDAEVFLLRLDQYRQGRERNPNYLRVIWEEERNRLFARMKDNGQIGPLDQHLGPDGLDITIAPLQLRRP